MHFTHVIYIKQKEEDYIVVMHRMILNMERITSYNSAVSYLHVF